METTVKARCMKDGSLSFRNGNASFIYCILENKEWSNQYDNIKEVIISPHNVIKTLIKLMDNGVRIRL